MTISQAATRIEGTVTAAVAAAVHREVQGGYASDLLSDVIAHGEEGDLWITMQKHVNIVAVAQLKSLAGIIIVHGRQPDAETIARAEKEQIPLICTPLPAFEAAGILYGCGLMGRRKF